MSIKLKGSTDGSVTLQAPADTSPTGTDKTFTLPTADGSANQALTTNASGALSFFNGGPLFIAESTNNFALSGGAVTLFPADDEQADTDNCWNNSTYRFTPNVAGYYQFNCTIRADIANQTALHVYFYKNGSAVAAGNFSNATNSQGSTTGSCIVQMNGTTDYMEFYVYSSVTGNALGGYQSACSGAFIRPA